jgi:hypothetical protein
MRLRRAPAADAGFNDAPRAPKLSAIGGAAEQLRGHPASGCWAYAPMHASARIAHAPMTQASHSARWSSFVCPEPEHTAVLIQRSFSGAAASGRARG